MPVPGGHPSNLTRAKERRFSQSPRQEVSVLRYQSDPLRQSAAESPCPPSPRVRVSIKCIKCSCHQTTTATPSDHTSMAAKNSYGAISSPPSNPRPGPRDPLCSQCSTDREKIYHCHVSTEQDWEKATEEGKQTYKCFVCNTDHSALVPPRRKVLFTSSTLINFWKSVDFIASVHFEVEAVVGAKVRDLTKVFRNKFGNKPAPIDVF